MALSGGSTYTPQQIASSLVRNGASPQEAATFAGVLHYESRGYTGSFGYQGSENGGALNPSGAFGLAQLNGSRQGDLLNYAGTAGNAAVLDTQTGFLLSEARGRGIDLTSHSDIVNRYEIPRVDLRPGEIAGASRITAGIDQGSLGGDGTAQNEAPDPNALFIKIRPKNAPVPEDSNAGTGSGGLGGGRTAAGSMTVPQAIDTQTRGAATDTAALNKASASNTAALNKTATANTASVTGKAQSLYDTTSKSLSDYFVRLVFIVVGLIALAAALVMFKPVQNAAALVVPAGRVAKGVKALKAVAS